MTYARPREDTTESAHLDHAQGTLDSITPGRDAHRDGCALSRRA
jgi:hypothetical protein